MIKLKDILAESTKVELHKIITAKDNPSFMTEEEWAGKWETNTLLKEINEAKSPAEVKKIVKKVEKKIPLLQKWVAKAISSNIKNDPKVRKLLQKFLKTGKITRGDAASVWPRIITYMTKVTGPGLIASTFVLLGGFAIYALPFTIVLIWALFQYDLAGTMKYVVPGGITPEEQKEWVILINKRAEEAKAKGKSVSRALGLDTDFDKK